MRRTTVARLRALGETGLEPRVVLGGRARSITSARSKRRAACCIGAGIPLRSAAIAPEEATITGADW